MAKSLILARQEEDEEEEEVGCMKHEYTQTVSVNVHLEFFVMIAFMIILVLKKVFFVDLK